MTRELLKYQIAFSTSTDKANLKHNLKNLKNQGEKK